MGKVQYSIIVKASISGRSVFMDRFSKLPIVIGRDESCEVSFPDMGWLSGKNTSIVEEDGILQLVDLESSNGTYVGMQKIDRFPLTSHETFKIGKLKVEVLITVIDEDSLNFETIVTAKELAKHPVEYEDIYGLGDKTELTELVQVPQADQPELPDVTNVPNIPDLPDTLDASDVPDVPEDTATIPIVDATHEVASDDELTDFSEAETQVSAQPKIPESPPEAPKTVIRASRVPKKPNPTKPTPNVGIGGDDFNRHRTEVTRPMNIQPSWGMNFVQRVPEGKMALEATLKWRGETLENHVYYEGESVYLNGQPDDGIHLPSLKTKIVPLAVFRGSHTKAILPSSCKGEFFDGETGSLKKTIEPSYDSKNLGFRFARDSFRIHFQNDLTLDFKHVEAPQPFSQIRFFLPEKLFQKAIATSGFLHAIVIILGFLVFPPAPAPKVKNLPPRIAKLLVKKPKPVVEKKKPKPKPPEEKKVAKKKPEKKKAKPKKLVKKKKMIKKRKPPKKVVVRKSKKLKKLNKYPFTVKTRNTAKRPTKGRVSKKKNVKQIGALAALGALGKSTPNPSNKPVAININKNAGGAPGKMKANSVIGALKQKGGKLVAGGSGSLKTKGKGYGTGTGYGVQGIKGSAGARGVAATVVGEPRLMKLKSAEGLTQKQVMNVVRKYSGKISSCYERALLNNPGLSGRIEYEWKIRATGSVDWAKVKASNISGADALNRCVVGVFRSMKFPRAKNGRSTLPSIGFPFGRL